MKTLILASLISPILTSSVLSQTMFGHSNTSCIEFLTEYESNPSNSAVSNWILGYFSGRIRETGRELKIVNELNIPLYDLLHKECSNNPNLTLREAADIVYTIIP